MKPLETVSSFARRLGISEETVQALADNGLVRIAYIGSESFAEQIGDLSAWTPVRSLVESLSIIERKIARGPITYRALSQHLSSYGIRKGILQQALASMVETGRITVADAPRDADKIYSISA